MLPCTKLGAVTPPQSYVDYIRRGAAGGGPRLMYLDIPTLAVVTVFVTALLGILLIFASLQNRAVRAPRLWGLAFVLAAAGMALVIVRGQVPDWLSIQIANALVLTGLGLIWVGARLFDGRPPQFLLIMPAPALWFVACAVPAIGNDINLRTIVASALSAVLAIVAAAEIWRGRAEPLLSRWPTVVTLIAYGGAMLVRIPLTLTVPQPDGEHQTIASALYPLVAFGTLMFTVVLAFLLLNMSKERTELRHKTASLIDPLCGVSNRRAFLAGAERLIAQQRVDGTPLAMLLFDLDHFKTINDHLGHAAGDDVLRAFAIEATRTLGAGVLFGRIGGEEFAALMPARSVGEAAAVAERLRRNFVVAAHAQFDIGIVTPTVSTGVALGCDQHVSVAGLMAQADRALYRAKANGRNRVESATTEAIMPPAPNVEDMERRVWRKVSARA
ncbi:GGDEF domain-containing protein [Pseudolabrys taiwanensis]|uniref:diguanylate cyclase n=2 Tax=Pseudolabrys taiwanensis TaxID=331696 RepID=A0A345ZTF6_9HYPH|nr:GGDEF domain-containing protein [Pseudolabrys taiwanensis]